MYCNFPWRVQEGKNISLYWGFLLPKYKGISIQPSSFLNNCHLSDRGRKQFWMLEKNNCHKTEIRCVHPYVNEEEKLTLLSSVIYNYLYIVIYIFMCRSLLEASVKAITSCAELCTWVMNVKNACAQVGKGSLTCFLVSPDFYVDVGCIKCLVCPVKS